MANLSQNLLLCLFVPVVVLLPFSGKSQPVLANSTSAQVSYSAHNYDLPIGTVTFRESQGPKKGEVKVGVILPLSPNYPWSLLLTRPAVEIAVETAKNDLGLLKGWDVTLNFTDSNCSEVEGPLAAIDMYVERRAHVFLGPACEYALAPVARFSPRWGIPILTAGGLVEAFADKHQYRLLTRVQGPYAKMTNFLIQALTHFNFRTAAMLYYLPVSGRKSNCWFALKEIFDAIEGLNPKGRFINVAFDPDYVVDYKDLLLEVSKGARIILLCADLDVVRHIMISAHELGFDKGEYAFIHVDFFSDMKDLLYPWHKAGDGEERNLQARQAFESVLLVSVFRPKTPRYQQFARKVQQRGEQLYPYFYKNHTNEVNSYVGAFHDAFLLYATAVDAHLRAGGSPLEGNNITSLMWDTSIDGVTGNFSIDRNGDRNSDYSLFDMDESGKFVEVGNYFGSTGIFELLPDRAINWPGGRGPPADTPRCGFDGALCQQKPLIPDYAKVVLSLSVLLLVVLIVAILVCRYTRMLAKRSEKSWRIKADDLFIRSSEKLDGSIDFVISDRRASMASIRTAGSVDLGHRQVYTKIGHYQGSIVAIKMLARNSVINKQSLREIIQVQSVQHDHLVRFIGLCLDPPHRCIVTEYCPKGSLQDVLENDTISLDWMFRYSIMQDVIKGVCHLHSTELSSHGSLKSTNCVVDSRFVVKLADYGLPSLREDIRNSAEENTYTYHRSLLWTAPELLRMKNRPARGTQKGDVYSFAVICQEVIYRQGVFWLSDLDLSPEEIVQRVRARVVPPFRPTLEENDCPCDGLAQLLRRCWADNPQDRPEFGQIKLAMRKFNKDGDRGNILDNLLNRMEQYANNLESLVQERTADFLEQKKKAEDLLSMMLPKSVANQLIRGETVQAESYECVTIYFSDIVSFTVLSSQSTAMQIVDFLNDLYTTFDSIIESFDVYKVETIGDAYMVVSGLPVRNGSLHAREIARMSLAILNAIGNFRIRHRPEEKLKLRIGIHSGPVCAGVVGLKMPRYCLFGDTVNTASRMESSGEAQRIHVSPSTYELLLQFKRFVLELRGPTELKGKGTVVTYWLGGEVASKSPHRERQIRTSSPRLKQMTPKSLVMDNISPDEPLLS